MGRIDDVHSDMFFHNLCHQAVHRASYRRNELKHVSAAGFSLQRTLNCFNLAPNAAHAGDKFRLLTDRVGQDRLLYAII